MPYIYLALSLLLVQIPVFSQLHRQPSSSEIRLKLKKLNFLGSVLYIAAHPDDENTRVISYLSNDRLATTAYLSLTRGDGGQNLIGPEIGELLGVIRTQELLAARRVDGGQQFFTRAIDFGFSKNAQESLTIWNKEEVLSDVVRVIRQFKPDVMITRFPPDERAGHGHHTASAMLAQEAFTISGNANRFPNQVVKFGIHQPKAIYTNTGRWWNKTINQNTPGVISLDVGTYNALLGKSQSEIAAESRTQHKSQGFGVATRRGEEWEFFEFINGEKGTKDILDNINTSWDRVKGAEKIQLLVKRAIEEFCDEEPALSIPTLVEIRQEINKLPNSIWKERKTNEVNRLIFDCAGLFIQVANKQFWVSPGQPIRSTIEIVNRSAAAIVLESVSSKEIQFDTTIIQPLKNNVLLKFDVSHRVKSTQPYSSPYWLESQHGVGLFTVRNDSLIGSPQNDAAITFRFSISINENKISYQVPLTYKWTDPIKGELTRWVEIVPPVFLNLDKPVYLFKDEKPQQVSLTIKSSSDNQKGVLKLQLPAGWKTDPVSIPFHLAQSQEEKTVSFRVTPSRTEARAAIQAMALIEEKQYGNSLQLIQYDHIPIQTLLPTAAAVAVRVDIQKKGSLIGYIKGAGDEVPTSLRNMGFEVWEIKNEEITMDNLQKMDAVVLGIRALNTNNRIRYTMPHLLEYVKNGGTLIVQYNTNTDYEIDPNKISPYPITLSRDRVTEENSDVRILKPTHRVFNYPNKITSKDFDGWVQERGLYFPSSWDKKYDALLSMNDTGETAKEGSLLIAPYGKGYYVYTSLSFFRELPAGVIGAYKLFANLVSLQQ